MARTRIAIIGGGPSGLIVAIELGRRGVPCILLEEDATSPTLPKANATTSRTMEHYRRLGFAAEIRALGLPEDYPQDITYFTRYTRYELARLQGRSRREALDAREGADSRWPTPEPLHRVQQMYIEAVLKAQAEKWPAANVRFGWRVRGLEQREDGVTVEAEQVSTGKLERIEADYAVGCDGPKSLVRAALGVGYEGLAREERDFMGGRMLAVYIRSRAYPRRPPRRLLLRFADRCFRRHAPAQRRLAPLHGERRSGGARAPRVARGWSLDLRPLRPGLHAAALRRQRGHAPARGRGAAPRRAALGARCL